MRFCDYAQNDGGGSFTPGETRLARAWLVRGGERVDCWLRVEAGY